MWPIFLQTDPKLLLEELNQTRNSELILEAQSNALFPSLA